MNGTERTDIAMLFARLEEIKFILNRYRSQFAKANTIIDLGCGPGTTTGLLHDSFNFKRIIGIDINEDYIDYAKTYCSKCDNTEFYTKDCYDTAFEDNQFDMAFAMNLFEFLGYPDRALAEIKRIVKPDGKILLIDFNHKVENIIAIPKPRHSDKIMKLNRTIMRYKKQNPNGIADIEKYLKELGMETNFKEIISCDSKEIKDFIRRIAVNSGLEEFKKNTMLRENEIIEYYEDIRKFISDKNSYFCIKYDVLCIRS